uniref:Glycosyltransferase family 92 protein n=1 Tax=Meloidogyne floridensis TaxID=298350 RepID=A0A915NU54_9BILA
MVMLFNVEKDVNIENLRKGSACLVYSNYGWPIWRKAYIEPIIGHRPEFECKLSVYRLACHNMELNPYYRLSQQSVEIKISRHSKPFQVQLKWADRIHRKFVVCPSRLFAFDQWHLFITAMEIYRAHKVDLVQIYIQSVDPQIFKLIKVYEKNGILQIRPALEMPIIDSLDFNPNSETSWQNQLVNFQDCLYEYRESADFIAFPDWDDFMFTRSYSIPYSSVLNKLAYKHPKYVGFIVDRYLGVHESLEEMTKKEHNIVDFWHIGIQYSKRNKQFYYGKAIYIPNNGLFGVDLHWANRVEADDYQQIRVPMEDMYIIHARDYSKFPMNGYIHNVDYLEKNFNKFIEEYNLTEILSNLPKKEELVQQFNECLGFDSQNMKEILKNIKSKCWNYHHCGITEVKNNCTNVKNQWEKIFMSGDELNVYMLINSEFLKESICSY